MASDGSIHDEEIVPGGMLEIAATQLITEEYFATVSYLHVYSKTIKSVKYIYISLIVYEFNEFNIGCYFSLLFPFCIMDHLSVPDNVEEVQQT